MKTTDETGIQKTTTTIKKKQRQKGAGRTEAIAKW